MFYCFKCWFLYTINNAQNDCRGFGPIFAGYKGFWPTSEDRSLIQFFLRMLDQNAFIMLWRDRGDAKLRLAARVDSDTAAALLGFASSDIPIMVAAAELKPLGSPADNATKYFWLGDVAERAADRKWLDKATKVVSRHWKDKRVRRKARQDDFPPVESPQKPLTEAITKGR